MMNEAELAWSAGFFDGEGSVSIARATKQNLGSLAVAVSQIDREPLDWMAGEWGGRVRRVTGKRADQREAWVWTIYANQALAFLTAIEPHIRLDRNRERIALAREFQEGARFGRHGNNEEYRAWRFGCWQRMGWLNERGVRSLDLEEVTVDG